MARETLALDSSFLDNSGLNNGDCRRVLRGLESAVGGEKRAS